MKILISSICVLFCVLIVVPFAVLFLTETFKSHDKSAKKSKKTPEETTPWDKIGCHGSGNFDYLEFSAVVVNGGKLEIEHKENFDLDEEIEIRNFSSDFQTNITKKKRRCVESFIVKNSLINFTYTVKESRNGAYFKNIEDIEIKFGNKNLQPIDEETKKLVYLDIYRMYKAMKDKQKMEIELKKQEAEMKKTLADKQYIIDLLKNKLESDRVEYAQKLENEKHKI